jgi:hypothetical protein
MVVLYLLRDVGPRYYHTAGFWRRELTWKDKTSHLSAREYRRFINKVNPIEYRKLSQNKIAEKAMLSLFDLPTPRFVGRLARHAGLNREGAPLRNSSELATLIRQNRFDRLVFKQLEGYGGKGVRIAHFRLDEKIVCAELGETDFSKYVSLENFCASVLRLPEGTDWLIEEYFFQHPLMAGLNPLSVNTIRIWIYDPSKTGGTVITAYVRIGRRGMYVDNVSSGGIVARIDLATGKLGTAQDTHAERRIYSRHPDHGNPIEGLIIPHWAEVQSLAKRALVIFPNLQFAGLDIAIGQNGPVVLELNVVPDREGAARTDCPDARLLR